MGLLHGRAGRLTAEHGGLRPGQYRPEFLSIGRRLLFREGRTKGVGKIVSISYDGLGPQPVAALRGAISPG
jgi:hypothetical protein